MARARSMLGRANRFNERSGDPSVTEPPHTVVEGMSGPDGMSMINRRR